MYAATASFDATEVTLLENNPGHWTAKPLKHVLQIVGDRGDFDPRRGRYVGLENIESWSGRLVGPDDVQPDGLVGYFNDGDILFGKLRPYLAKVLLCESSGSSSTEAMILRPQQGMYGRYFWYNLVTRPFINIVNGSTFGSKMPRANWDFVGSQMLPVPPLEEQRIIAAYLDRETGRIDALVERLERLIALLTEKRQAVISHAVSKGLNPDAPMKDSGIDWLGEVPADWEVKPLKYLVRVSGGGTPSKDNPDFWEGHIPWVTPKDMKRSRIDSTTDYVTDAATEQTSLRLIESEGVMIVVRGMILARTFPVAVNTVPVTINQDMKHLASATTSSGFLTRYLSASEHFILSLLDESGHGTKALRSEQFFATPCLVPPSGEQEEIISFCETEEARFDTLMLKAETEIKTLKERRSALISAAVTGQIPIAEMTPDITPEDAA